MKRPFSHFFSVVLWLLAGTNGYGQPPHIAALRAANANGANAGDFSLSAAAGSLPFDAKRIRVDSKNAKRISTRASTLTKYEQTCALRFFEFCDYLITPPDIIIDSASYSGAEKKDEVVMQRERAEDTARIKKAVLRYTVVPVPTITTTDSLHFSQEEMSDQTYRNLENAFASMEKLLDTCYNTGGTPLKLVPLRLHDNAFIRSQVGQGQLSRTFLLQRGRRTLAVLVFTPQSRMTPTRPPRICGWSVDFSHGRMVFHNISALGELVVPKRDSSSRMDKGPFFPYT